MSLWRIVFFLAFASATDDAVDEEVVADADIGKSRDASKTDDEVVER